ncbi:TPA: C40 family peptidase [Pseudomonas aeruginosa]|nr:phage tail protein [Pseudomonas aeruginosa]HCI1894341.1 C40 family peptidase [Pseudomonas aeruginosa]HCI1999251.1 C40 family peptidase [Pseudomonas aeruginosa]HCI2254807.1 C40 family peptidase [Pseudomonas aeruginosa]HCI2629456.1 C40 family peptidase [Pseudomonas aeruginosa]
MLKHILSAVQKHAAAEYPRECCGLIIRSGRSQRYVPCENTAADASEEFRIAPAAYAEAEDQGEIVAVVHSHPDATSRPSAADVAMCNASGLTWHILSWPEGDLRTIEPVDQVPLLGRAFVHGVQDCWQVCSDWYQRAWGIEFPHFERADGWWERADGPSLYEQRFEGAGFIRVDRPQRGDMIVMAVGRTAHPNHAGIYLADDPSLPGEDAQHFGAGPFLLHHLYGKPSEIIVFGGPWLDRMRLVLRHRTAKAPRRG